MAVDGLATTIEERCLDIEEAFVTAAVGFAAGADSVEAIAAWVLVLTLALPALDWLVAGRGRKPEAPARPGWAEGLRQRCEDASLRAVQRRT